MDSSFAHLMEVAGPLENVVVERNDSNEFALQPREHEAILQAAWNCNLKVLEGLVAQAKAGCLDGRVSGPGYGAAHFAAALGNLEILELLLANGIDKNDRDTDGNSPLIWVVTSDGPDEMLEALVDHGATINLKNFVGESALSLACQRGFAHKAEYLLENGADPNNRNLDAATPLHAAAALGDLALIDLLVRWGAHLNATDDEGDSPLHWAVREAQPAAAQRLIELGADLSLSNEDGENPVELMLACGDQALANQLVVFAGAAKPVTTFVSLQKPFVSSEPAVIPNSNNNNDAAMADEMEHALKGLSVQERRMRTASFGGFPDHVVIY